ncbi:MAG: putative lipid II flippase FtsW [Clostridia bacterium]|nr:putative lipid II flippase FtsW [Clostridia bacterium]
MLLKTKFFDKNSIIIALLTIVLCTFGILMVYSASCYNAEHNFGTSTYFVTKQLIGFGLGIVAMFVLSRVDYHFLSKMYIPALIVGILLLIVVLIPGVGISSYGARRWIGFGPLSFQASEISKFCFIIFCAGYMTKYKDRMTTFVGTLPILCSGLVMCLLIMLEPNMSITICFGVVMVVMLLIGGMRIKHLAGLSVPAFCAVPLLILTEPYRLKRLFAFINPWASPQGEGFQLIQSLYALGAGNLFGVGLFNSQQKYAFLPFSESDFIFSIIGEELGFVGALGVMLAFAVLIFFGYKVSINAKDRFGCYLGVGITSILAVQVLLNIAVVTGAIPPTGLPLPFISAGSTSLVVFMAAIGVLLNINKQSKSI